MGIYINTEYWLEYFFNSVPRPKLLILTNRDFLLPHIAHFDNIIVSPLLVFEILGFMF